MSEILRYDNGLKVGVETIPSLRSVSVGYWAGVGSSKELPVKNLYPQLCRVPCTNVFLQ